MQTLTVDIFVSVDGWAGGTTLTEVSRLKGDSDVPLRTMGSLSVARQLLSAGLVDRLRLMTFPLLLGAVRPGAGLRGRDVG
jgi:dihydrofolate reductase